MEGYKKIILIAVILIALVGIGFYYLLVYEKSKEISLPSKSLEKPQEVIKKPVPAEKPAIKEERKLPELALDLDKSDDTLRKLAKECSSHPQWAIWLSNKNLIRRITAVIDNIAQGLSPRPHIPFLAPQEKFQVIKRNGLVYLNPASYKRYNLIADVFASLDVEGCVKIYQQLRPLFQEAYQELGYPNQDFQDTLFKAIIELLKTPLVKGEILLKKKVITYQMVDPQLEQLSPAQKHLIRMGPENTLKIQEKLREMALALGIPQNQIPQSRVYYPKNEQ
ncbi:MAG: DUF3014 domain-containing protein [Candidatus Desulfofervidus sp.]|nr:DUF3014 domain-containing protein [Candidatus Desulfofervidus sp.]